MDVFVNIIAKKRTLRMKVMAVLLSITLTLECGVSARALALDTLSVPSSFDPAEGVNDITAELFMHSTIFRYIGALIGKYVELGISSDSIRKHIEHIMSGPGIIENIRSFKENPDHMHANFLAGTNFKKSGYSHDGMFYRIPVYRSGHHVMDYVYYDDPSFCPEPDWIIKRDGGKKVYVKLEDVDVCTKCVRDQVSGIIDEYGFELGRVMDGTVHMATPQAAMDAIFKSVQDEIGDLTGKNFLELGAGDLRVSLWASNIFGMEATSCEKDPGVSEKALEIFNEAHKKGFAGRGKLELLAETDAFDISWSGFDMVYLFYPFPAASGSDEEFRRELKRKSSELPDGAAIAILFTSDQTRERYGRSDIIPGLTPLWQEPLNVSSARGGLYLGLYRPVRGHEENVWPGLDIQEITFPDGSKIRAGFDPATGKVLREEITRFAPDFRVAEAERLHERRFYGPDRILEKVFYYDADGKVYAIETSKDFDVFNREDSRWMDMNIFSAVDIIEEAIEERKRRKLDQGEKLEINKFVDALFGSDIPLYVHQNKYVSGYPALCDDTSEYIYRTLKKRGIDPEIKGYGYHVVVRVNIAGITFIVDGTAGQFEIRPWDENLPGGTPHDGHRNTGIVIIPEDVARSLPEAGARYRYPDDTVPLISPDKAIARIKDTAEKKIRQRFSHKYSADLGPVTILVAGIPGMKKSAFLSSFKADHFGLGENEVIRSLDDGSCGTLRYERIFHEKVHGREGGKKLIIAGVSDITPELFQYIRPDIVFEITEDGQRHLSCHVDIATDVSQLDESEIERLFSVITDEADVSHSREIARSPLKADTGLWGSLEGVFSGAFSLFQAWKEYGSFGTVHFKEGEYVVRQGEESGSVYIVKEGIVEIEVAGQKITTVGPGEWLGEISLFFQIPRTASARVVSPGGAELYRVTARKFKEKMKSQGSFQSEISDLAVFRLINTIKKLRGGLEKEVYDYLPGAIRSILKSVREPAGSRVMIVGHSSLPALSVFLAWMGMEVTVVDVDRDLAMLDSLMFDAMKKFNPDMKRPVYLSGVNLDELTPANIEKFKLEAHSFDVVLALDLIGSDWTLRGDPSKFVENISFLLCDGGVAFVSNEYLPGTEASCERMRFDQLFSHIVGSEEAVNIPEDEVPPIITPYGYLKDSADGPNVNIPIRLKSGGQKETLPSRRHFLKLSAALGASALNELSPVRIPDVESILNIFVGEGDDIEWGEGDTLAERFGRLTDVLERKILGSFGVDAEDWGIVHILDDEGKPGKINLLKSGRWITRIDRRLGLWAECYSRFLDTLYRDGEFGKYFSVLGPDARGSLMPEDLSPEISENIEHIISSFVERSHRVGDIFRRISNEAVEFISELDPGERERIVEHIVDLSESPQKEAEYRNKAERLEAEVNRLCMDIAEILEVLYQDAGQKEWLAGEKTAIKEKIEKKEKELRGMRILLGELEVLTEDRAGSEPEKRKRIDAILADAEKELVNFIDSMKLVQDASKNSDPIRIALGTGWFKGYVKGEGQYDALNPLVIAVRRFCASKGISLVVAEDKDLMNAVRLDSSRKYAEARRSGKEFIEPRTIIIAGRETVTSPEYLDMKTNEKIFLVGVDGRELECGSYIRLLEIITFAFNLKFPSLLTSSPGDHPHIGLSDESGVPILLPRATPLFTYEELKAFYEVQRSA